MDEFNLNNILEHNEAVMPKAPAYKMVALRGVVVFPGQTVHFDIGRDKSLAAVERPARITKGFFLRLSATPT